MWPATFLLSGTLIAFSWNPALYVKHVWSALFSLPFSFYFLSQNCSNVLRLLSWAVWKANEGSRAIRTSTSACFLKIACLQCSLNCKPWYKIAHQRPFPFSHAWKGEMFQICMIHPLSSISTAALPHLHFPQVLGLTVDNLKGFLDSLSSLSQDVCSTWQWRATLLSDMNYFVLGTHWVIWCKTSKRLETDY